MLLTGTFVRTLDDKQRLALPKPIREALGEPLPAALYLAPGTDGSLAMYTDSVFARLAADMGRLSPAGQDMRAFSRLFYAQAQRVELDRQGRLRIPAEMTSFFQANKEVVLLGVRDHLELWGRSRWEAYLAAMQPHYDQIAESALQNAFAVPQAGANSEAAGRFASTTDAGNPASLSRPSRSELPTNPEELPLTPREVPESSSARPPQPR